MSAIEAGATAFLDINLHRNNKLTLDIFLEHSEFLQYSNIFIVGKIVVINNNNNPYILELYDYIDGIKIDNNNNNNFYIKNNYVCISNLQIIGNQEIIIRCNLENSAVFTSKKFIIKNEISNYFFDINNSVIKEANDNTIVCNILKHLLEKTPLQRLSMKSCLMLLTNQ